MRAHDSLLVSDICCIATLSQVVQGGCNAVMTGALSEDAQA